VCDPRWRLEWENDLSAENHEGLAIMLARAYPLFGDLFRDGRSWSGARPELRVVGYDGERPIAHLGVLRRFLRVPDTGAAVLVGDVGLVAVDPDFRGNGVGRALLEQTTRTLTELGLPFGYLTCRPAVVPFYESAGWQRVEGQVTRMIANDHRPEVYGGPAMVVPVHAAMSDWPHGHGVDRNGLEV
jgi:nodulation protein A